MMTSYAFTQFLIRSVDNCLFAKETVDDSPIRSAEGFKACDIHSFYYDEVRIATLVGLRQSEDLYGRLVAANQSHQQPSR